MTLPTTLHKHVQIPAPSSAGRSGLAARPGDTLSNPPLSCLSAHGLVRRLLLLAGLLPTLAIGVAQAAGERPRPENYDNYSHYIQALVDYQRAQEAAVKEAPKKSGAKKLCRDDQGEKSSEKKKNSCEGKYLLAEDLLNDEYEHKTSEEDLGTGRAGDSDSDDTSTASSGGGSGGGSDSGSDGGSGSDAAFGSGSGSGGYGSNGSGSGSGRSGSGSGGSGYSSGYGSGGYGSGSGGSAGRGSSSGLGAIFGPGAGGGDYESVEDVIARAGYQQRAVNIDDGNPDQRPTYNGVPMTEIPVSDLSEAGISGLLGLVENVRTKGVTGTPGSGFVPGLGNLSGVSSSLVQGSADGSDGSILAMLSNYQLTFYQPGILNLGNFSLMSNGYSIVDANVFLSGDNGVGINLSSTTYMQLWVVDRDGMPRTDFDYAGAINLDQVGVIVPHLEVNIQGTRASNGEDLMRIDAYSPQSILVDLRNTQISAADAVRDGSRIGAGNSFLVFGPNSVLTVGAGTQLRVDISEPSGLAAPFVTLNGRVGDISLDDIKLLDHDGNGGIRIARLGLQGLNFVDSKIYLDDTRVVIDAGRGMKDIGLDIERFSFGNDVSESIVGDFYARGGHLQNLRMTAVPH